jgi:hypothetical protein
MSVVSVMLMLLATKQQPMLRKMGTGWQVPARVWNSVLNGPGFFSGWIPIPTPDAVDRALSYDGNRLFGVGIFWFLIGLSIERRAKGWALDQHHPVRAGILFTLGALVCGALAFGGFLQVFCPSPNMTCWDQISRELWPTLRLIITYPLRTTDAMDLWVTLWFSAFCVYFVKRTIKAAIRSTRTEN